MRVLSLSLTCVVAGLLIYAMPRRLHAQTSRGSTIPELLGRVAPEPLLQAKFSEFTVPPLEEMAHGSDLVVRGTITSLNTYLSADQRDLFTEYVVTPTRVLAQKIVIAGRAPGQAVPIVFRKWGGETTINGVSVKLVDMTVPNFSVGEQVLLLLSFDNQLQKFVLSHGVGAFNVINSRVEPRVKHPDIERYRGESLEQFEVEVERALR